MTNPQGTAWESEIRRAYTSLGLASDRHPKRGQAGEPDLWVGNPGAQIGVVAWKRLVGKKSDGPRQPNGERRVIIIEFDDFRQLIKALMEAGIKPSFQVQAKWTTNLNVTKTLGLLRSWLSRLGNNA